MTQIYIAAAILGAAILGGCAGFTCFALFKVYQENKEIRRLRDALEEIIVECGKVDISNWPAQQQRSQAIAFRALHHEVLKGH